MGEIADMMMDGTLDAETGEFLDGESPGYPRTRRGGRTVSRSAVGCPVCGKTLKSDQGVKDHMAAKHPESK